MKKLAFALLFLLSFAVPSRALVAPTAISTVTVVGSTVTVNAVAHGLLASLPSGFCISGSSVPQLNLCGVVATSIANSFTFILAAAPACASSCGSVLPAKHVIWLSTLTVAGGYQVNYLLWITTASPAGGKQSAWTGASAAESAAVSSGAFMEVSRPGYFFPVGTNLATAETILASDWSEQQLLQTGSVQPGAFFGDYFDGTGWLQ